MKFGKVQSRKFSSNDGAYSIVTDRENIDSQITFTDYEAELVISHFGKNQLHIGNVKSNRQLSSKVFKLYPSGKEIKLNVIYPKPEKTELRLYISSSAGFKPKGGEVWFVFLKEGDIWIGAMSESNWRDESSELKRDDGDDVYQSIVNDTNTIRIATLKARDIYARDRKVALERMKLSGFACEYNPKHKLFTSRFTDQPYLEAHHLIPMGLQKDFKKSLDTVHNVFCLCPYCHRAVHQATEPFAKKILGTLADQRPVLDNYSLSLNDLFGLYAVETIK
ncbi:MAG: HNH endonuclease [Sideroxyarcus sp.]